MTTFRIERAINGVWPFEFEAVQDFSDLEEALASTKGYEHALLSVLPDEDPEGEFDFWFGAKDGKVYPNLDVNENPKPLPELLRPYQGQL
jgi:hypothetical protein